MQTPLVAAGERPDPARTQRRHYPVWQQVTTRFGDLDPLGHINNVAITQLYEESRVRFAQVVAEHSAATLHRVVRASLNVHFLGETHYPDPVEVGVGVARIGRSSYQLAHALYQRDRCVGLADSTLVHAPVTGVAELPEEFRAALERFRLT